MEMYKQASKYKVRFTTPKGSLTSEQLWDLPVTELDEMAVALEEEYKGSSKKSFITGNSGKDKTAKLRFDIVLDVLNTKLTEAEEARIAKENKAWNEMIMEAIEGKEIEELKGKTPAQLRKLLR